jgi:hypothetical protein
MARQIAVLAAGGTGQPSNITQVSGVNNPGALAAQAYSVARVPVDGVIRGDDGATYSVPGVRASNPTSISSTILRLLADANTRGINSASGNSDGIIAIPDLQAGYAHLAVQEARKPGYFAALKGRRYVCKSPDMTGVAAATSLTLTAPTFLIVPGATKEVIVRRVTVSMPLKGTSTTFRALIKTDTANRYSSGGTARAPGTLNQGNTIATGLTRNTEAPTATSESTVVGVGCKSGLVSDGAVIEFLFEDGLIVPASGSFLLYVITATNAATIDYEIEFEEVDVQ